MEKKEIIEKIQSYINTEESNLKDEIKPKTIEKTNTGKINLDDIFGEEDNNQNNNINEYENRNSNQKIELDFWNKNKNLLKDALIKNEFSNDDFWVLKDAMNIIRGKYYMNETFKTVDKEFQDMCSIFISFQLQKHDIGINNFLRYFDPESAYYKRIKALTLFRNLSKPFYEIEGIRDEVCTLLYESTKLEPESIDKSINILKEYIERVFTIKHTNYDSRMDFILKSSNARDSWFSIPTFSEWIIKYISGEEITINKIENDIEEIPEQNQNDENEKVLTEKINKQSGEIKELLDVIAKNEKTIIDVKTQKEIAEAKKEEIELKYKQVTDELEKQLENTKKEYLESIKRKEEENDELKRQIEILSKANENKELEHKKDEAESIVHVENQENILERRKAYRITVVGGSDKTNKKYNQLLKTGFNGELYERFGIKKEQLGELYGDYNKQSQKGFEKKIEDDILLERTNFVIVLQTDHETGLYKLINNSNYLSRITYFAEREENNKNPKYTDQSFSKERFFYYLNRAIEKYERSEINNIS